MRQVTISSKNQITLPSRLLRDRNLTPGKKLYIFDNGDDIVLTTKNPLEQYLAKAKKIQADATVRPVEFDPLNARQKLRMEWADNEQSQDSPA